MTTFMEFAPMRNCASGMRPWIGASPNFYVMLPGMKQRIDIPSGPRSGQTMVRP
jgi:hypothetical protein